MAQNFQAKESRWSTKPSWSRVAKLPGTAMLASGRNQFAPTRKRLKTKLLVFRDEVRVVRVIRQSGWPTATRPPCCGDPGHQRLQPSMASKRCITTRCCDQMHIIMATASCGLTPLGRASQTSSCPNDLQGRPQSQSSRTEGVRSTHTPEAGRSTHVPPRPPPTNSEARRSRGPRQKLGGGLADKAAALVA